MKYTEEEILRVLNTTDFRYALLLYQENELIAVVYYNSFNELLDSYKTFLALIGDNVIFDIIDKQGKHQTINLSIHEGDCH